MSKTIKYILIVVLILVIVGVSYFMFFGKTSTLPTLTPKQSPSLQTSSGVAPTNSVISQTTLTEAEATRISQEFVNQLLNLQAIKLKDDILSSLAFQSLQDFSILLVQPGNEGRPNPFAPFGADEASPNSSGTVGDVVFSPGESWLMLKLGTKDIFYPPSWSYVPVNSSSQTGAQVSVIGYNFSLPNGLQVNLGGPQSSCTSSMFGSFQYGVSTKTCLKNTTVEIVGQNLSIEDKNIFGDFVQRNM